MNIQRYVLSFGSAAILASLITGCSKSTSSHSAVTETTSVTTTKTNTVTYDGGYNADAPVVAAITIDGITLDSKKDPKLAPFIKTYADYGYDKGQIFGAPKKTILGNVLRDFVLDKSAGSFIEFKPKDPTDKHFHAITEASGSDKAYAVWGVIGDAFKQAHHVWGFPTSFETSDVLHGIRIYTQHFENGTVSWDGKGEPHFTKKP